MSRLEGDETTLTIKECINLILEGLSALLITASCAASVWLSSSVPATLGISAETQLIQETRIDKKMLEQDITYH